MIDLPQNTWQALFGEGWHDTPRIAPQTLQPWLLDQGSLTQKLADVYQNTISVQLLHQTLCYASPRAANKLEIEEGAALLHREVLLCDGDKPLVFACSLLPEQALIGRYEELRQLDDRPLGHWIFAEPALERATMQYASLPSDDALFVRVGHLFAQTNQLWGRATCFKGAACPLLVSEFFLPTLIDR